MSNEENTEKAVDTEKTVESATNKVGNIISLMLSLKEKNPKVFFGAIGGVVVLLILIMSGGDEAKVVSGPKIKNLAVGQKYVLKSANSYDPAATVRLVGVPGAIAAYDDTEEADRNASCQHIAQGTPVSVVELQDAYGTKNAFVKVQMEEGECKGKDGWALAIDVQ
ncbi:MAG: hypothetical protein LUO95_04415 [Methylococcaceae bacterium]|nr:hypothetical protein [Methylococcaceae bacterium]MDD1609855.1 hypothetical protein [Methylococcaceae bacterium]MDD1616124.1 hypothetical protein [Methylococcaceae bacterium]OYV18529.1 MAG: hypothetical protein CG439_1243 [Methylococcaceae bacterium NSP1-2]